MGPGGRIWVLMVVWLNTLLLKSSVSASLLDLSTDVRLVKGREHLPVAAHGVSKHKCPFGIALLEWLAIYPVGPGGAHPGGKSPARMHSSEMLLNTGSVNPAPSLMPKGNRGHRRGH